MKIGVLLYFLFIALTFGLILPVSASSVEIDAVGEVYSVIDGDTFDAFPVGRVRLADIDAPEAHENGYTEAKNFLNSTIGQKLVYLDVDDMGVMDTLERLVCVVYVRHNLTHLLNVNYALLDEGHADIDDYPNEFSPYAWSLFVYYPTADLPDTYNELLQAYLNLQSDYGSLQTQYNDILGDYNALEYEYDNYQDNHSYSNSEYDALNSSYSQYEESHSYSDTEYDTLQNQYSKDLGMAQNLNYIMTAIAVGLSAFTIYLVARKKS